MTRKILVVDDEHDIEPLFRQRFRRELRDGSIEFIFAFSGEDALKVLRSDASAGLVLILSDINMPGMTGLELLDQIKHSAPPRTVYMVTAYGDAATREKAADLGADDFITKPIDFDLLKKRIGLP